MAACSLLPRGDDLIGRGDAGELAAVRGGEIVDRAGLAREEQPVVDRRGEHRPAIGLAGQRIRIGAARKGSAPQRECRIGLSRAGERAAEKADQLGHREVEERAVAAGLEFGAPAFRRNSPRSSAGRTAAADSRRSRRDRCGRTARLSFLELLGVVRATGTACRRARAAGRARRRSFPAARARRKLLLREDRASARATIAWSAVIVPLAVSIRRRSPL